MAVQVNSTEAVHKESSTDLLLNSGRNGVSPQVGAASEENDDVESLPEIENLDSEMNVVKRDLVSKDYPAKVIVHFRPVGGAPILKQKKFKVGTDKQFLSLQAFLKTQLKLSAKDTIYIYCNQAFSPSFDERIGDMYSCFKVGKELVLYYSLMAAWG